MQQRDVAPREFSWGGFVAGIVVLAVVAVAIGGFVWLGMKERARLQSPEGVAEMMLKDRTSAPFFQALKESYPQEFAAYSTQYAKRLREGATPQQLSREGFDWMHAAALRHRDDFVQAPHGDLNLYRQLEIQLIETLQEEDVDLCARYVMVGLSPADRRSSKIGERLIELSTAQITTSASGRDHAVHRIIPKGQIPQADAIALVKAMRAEGISQFDLETWGDSARMAQAGATRQCAIGLYVMRGIAALPNAQSDRVTGWLLYQKS